MLTLGLLNMRDAAAALVEDGRILAAAEEERFVRTKHVTALPIQAIRSCLHETGMAFSDLDAIAVPWKYWQVARRATLALRAMVQSPTLFRVKGRRTLDRREEWRELARLRHHLSRVFQHGSRRPTYLDHHLCHAASAYLPSPFERAAILVVDGASEAHTAMLALGEDDRITVLKRIPLPHSLGQFYAAMTAYLGFRPDHDEYIVMGLAAYGEPRFATWLRQNVLRTLPDGEFQLDTTMLDFHLARVGMFSRRLLESLGPARGREDEITQRHRDVAASVQQVLEETLLHLARHLLALTSADRLCLAGGVAFNCVANSRLRQELNVPEVFVQPAAGDAGAALGAALWVSHHGREGGRSDATTRTVMRDAYLGPRFDDPTCRAALDRAGLRWQVLSDAALYERVATELVRGRLVFWFQGRMEWGPRALGNRSLLADPRREDMRELINAKVKFRESFRPFAPAILAEDATDYFDTPSSSPFMLFTCPVRPSAKGLIPAVVHVDGTARIQTVDQTNPRFRSLLQAFQHQTGVPVLLNTSFNVQEPIVCTPEDAISCFLRTEVDWLAMGNLLVERPGAVKR
jgi:carbamoyltransferase